MARSRGKGSARRPSSIPPSIPRLKKDRHRVESGVHSSFPSASGAEQGVSKEDQGSYLTPSSYPVPIRAVQETTDKNSQGTSAPSGLPSIFRRSWKESTIQSSQPPVDDPEVGASVAEKSDLSAESSGEESKSAFRQPTPGENATSEEGAQKQLFAEISENQSERKDDQPVQKIARRPYAGTDMDSSANLFFGEPPPVSIENSTDWEDFNETEPMPKESRRAMYISFGIFAVALVGLGIYLTYQYLVIPAPAQLSGSSSGPILPQPISEQSEDDHTSRMSASDSLEKSPLLDHRQPQADSLRHQKEDISDMNSDQSPVVETPLAVKSLDNQNTKDKTEGTDSTDDPMSEVQHTVVSRIAKNSDTEHSDVEEFHRILKINPNDPEVNGKLAFYYLNNGKNEEAERFARRTIELDPTSSLGWIVLGASRDAQDDREGAEKAYRKCAEQGVGRYVTECGYLIGR